MTSLLIAACRVELHPSGLTVTHLPDGSAVQAWPHTVEAGQTPEEVEAYAARARELGYGGDVFGCSREHETLHSALAQILGLDASLTLAGVAKGEPIDAELSGAEESAVLSIQRFACLLRAKNVRQAR